MSRLFMPNRTTLTSANCNVRYLPSRRLQHSMSRTISLTPAESLFRRCLLDCRSEMDSVPGMRGLELRFTGGWVRDKLLNVQSQDIDVALSTMTGEQFGLALQQFMKNHGQKYVDEADAQGFASNIKDLHKIAKNPEKSKHLETITTKMFDIDVDLVNLRKEVYDEKSRNPQMEFGTPEEDALRRDATVNALFYNLDTQLVEDFTQRGLKDMEKHVIRTPLEPYQTFKDDPLRVLRLIRFASRLGYDIDPAALESMSDVTIHEALRLKISRERVGTEVGKIAAGPDPLRGMMLIFDHDLHQTVFADPANDKAPALSKVPRAYKALHVICTQYQNLSSALQINSKKNIEWAWTLAAYIPWEQSESEAVKAAWEGIRAPSAFTKILGDAIKRRSDIIDLVRSVEDDSISRRTMGMGLRNSGVSWRFHVVYSMLCDAAAEEDVDRTVAKYTAFFGYIHNQNLTDAASIKPLLNGNQVKEALEMTRAGPWLKNVMEEVVEWQFENPAGTQEDARTMLRERREQLHLD